LPFIDRRIGKDKLVEIFENRELGAADAIADRAGLPVRALGPDQTGDEGIDPIAPGKTFAGNSSTLTRMNVPNTYRMASIAHNDAPILPHPRSSGGRVCGKDSATAPYPISVKISLTTQEQPTLSGARSLARLLSSTGAGESSCEHQHWPAPR
jgi:hypothetical protein